MTSFNPKKIIYPLIAFLLVFTALVSGGINPWSKDLFVVLVLFAFILSMSTNDRPGLIGLWPAWALLGITFLSSAWTANLNATLEQAFSLTGYVLLACVTAYAADRERRAGLLKAALLAAALVSAYGIYQYFIGFAHTEEYLRQAGAASGMSQDEIARAMGNLGYRRAFSTMFSPNVLACYLAMVFPVGLALYFGEPRKERKYLYGFALALLFTAALLTKSIGGIVALVSGVLIFIAVKSYASHSPLFSRKMLAAVAVTVLVAAGAGTFVYMHRSGGFFGFETSVAQRRNYWTSAVRLISDSPVRGSGAGTFGILYPFHAPAGASETRFAHNLMLQTLTETGILGLTALIFVFGVYFIRCVKGGRAEGVGGILPGIAGGGAAFFVHNLLDFSYYIPETAILFWFFFGLTSAVRVRDTGFRAGDRIMGVLLIAVSLVFGFFYVKSYLAGQKQAESLELLRQNGITSPGLARSNPGPDEAVRLAGEAVALKPYDDSLHGFLALLYEGMAAKDGPVSLRKAEAEYREAIRLNPLYPYYYRDLGLLYLKVGDKGKAKEEFLMALQRYPASEILKKFPPLAEN